MQAKRARMRSVPVAAALILGSAATALFVESLAPVVGGYVLSILWLWLEKV